MAAKGGRVGRSLGQCGVNSLQNAKQISIDIAIPKAEHARAFMCKIVIPIFVVRTMGIEIVLTAIELNDKPIFQTHKIDNKAMSAALAVESGTPDSAKLGDDSRPSPPGALTFYVVALRSGWPYPTPVAARRTLPFQGRDYALTLFSICSTWAIGVGGRMP